MDAGALARWLAQERPRFVRLARSRLPVEADAEDLIQRASLRAVSRAGSLEDPARAGAWFTRIVLRAVADHYRTPHREEPADPADLEVAEEPPETRGNACPCATRLIGELRPAYAEILQRVDVQGEPTDAVASALGISTANLHVRLHRARHALREKLEAHCGVSSSAPCLDCTCCAAHRCGA